VNSLAVSHPHWHLVLVGPVVKIDPASLPVHPNIHYLGSKAYADLPAYLGGWEVALMPFAINDPNIHYLGSKAYADLPAYLGGWEVALMPFAINEPTRFISPTKTPEYLAGGRAVVSTPIVDVMRTYGSSSLVSIAGSATDFAVAIQRALDQNQDRERICRDADVILGDMSW